MHGSKRHVLVTMGSVTIRNLDDAVKTRLRIQAATNGRSMEAETREILRAALSAETGKPGNLGTTIQARFAPYGGLALMRPPREAIAVVDLSDEEAALIAAAEIPEAHRYSLNDA
jgi:plasmid stability protein